MISNFVITIVYYLNLMTYKETYYEILFLIMIVDMMFLIIGKPSQKLFFVIFSYLIILFTQKVIEIITNIFLQYIIYVNPDHWLFACLELLIFVFLILIYFVFKKHKSKFEVVLLENDEWKLFSAMAISTILYLLISKYLENFMTWESNFENILNDCAIIFFITANYYLFSLYLKGTIKKNRILFETERRLQTEEFNIKLHKQMEEANEQNRKLRHDLKNHMLMIKNKIDHDPQEANEYIEQLLGNVNNTTIIDGENEALIYILNMKNAIMQEKGISAKFILQSDLDIISEYDLTIIFGNLLDNAIEAQEHVEDKRIIVEIREDKDFYYIRIKNYYDPARIIKTNEEFKTSKENKEQHGYGLKNVEECVKRYHGIFQQETDDHYFITMISIPK